MRTSAPGSERERFARTLRLRRRGTRSSTGFTLLEMLIVLVIAGLLVALVTLAPSRNRRAELAEEAQRLASLLESAGDEAQVRSTVIAWQPVEGGYQFFERTQTGAWAPMAEGLFRPHHWAADGTNVSIRYTGSRESIARVVQGEESFTVPVTITLSSGTSRFVVAGTGIGNFVVQQP
ncbi:GspH/FimT family pseudopilin [Trinickia fusca]|uniref:Type II secretion system protein H n=1 Tax=Trinickia fusca TaxID=2419777 RepID=A0A494XPA1_9BURK|nr:GspH/FimT family pseudopilin [Trinickia fusca]RKP52480.1 type II secretion system protein GspH [Trinickia fusca]